MALRRHARKVAIWRAMAAATLATMLWIFAAALPIGAATTEYIVTDRNSGLAIHGFDPVAYFTNRAPLLGRGEYEHRHAGVVWRFRNPGNLGAFAADPDIYMPRFGGYDPIGVGRGVAVAGDPRIWLIVGDRLYLFQSPESKAAFAADSEHAAAAADDAWPTVQRTLSP